MTDLNDFIAERLAIHGAATEGPWEADDYGCGHIVGPSPASVTHCEECDSFVLSNEDRDAIVDAHNEAPKAWEALGKVLELHREMPIYDVEEACENTDEDHRDERHVESEDGILLCKDLPTGSSACRECRDSDGFEGSWPCATVKSITSALGLEGGE